MPREIVVSVKEMNHRLRIEMSGQKEGTVPTVSSRDPPDSTSFLKLDSNVNSKITSTSDRIKDMPSSISVLQNGGGHGSIALLIEISDRRTTQEHERRRRQMQPLSRTPSFTTSTSDSTVSPNIVTIHLNMNCVSFLGTSIVEQSNEGEDGGIYIDTIMKGDAVALDGRSRTGWHKQQPSEAKAFPPRPRNVTTMTSTASNCYQDTDR
ncbi:hypothetical protein QAD02_018844 [Eretmocerus hayati]|uniref:Uncharacterized protein n=1 Tax=Eretmocerus hayati TaxID=131215 RepID=A0ACC2PKW4_9HYME|nr:hypothetical protein QAD02_018844 [Eretmocerus hayati]